MLECVLWGYWPQKELGGERTVSNEILVLADGLVNTMAMDCPANGLKVSSCS